MCKTETVWKEVNLPFGNNENRSLGRLKSLVKNLKRDTEIHEAFHTVIQEPVQNKIKERASNNTISNFKEFYLPHKPLIQKQVE